MLTCQLPFVAELVIKIFGASNRPFYYAYIRYEGINTHKGHFLMNMKILEKGSFFNEQIKYEL